MGQDLYIILLEFDCATPLLPFSSPCPPKCISIDSSIFSSEQQGLSKFKIWYSNSFFLEMLRQTHKMIYTEVYCSSNNNTKLETTTRSKTGKCVIKYYLANKERERERYWFSKHKFSSRCYPGADPHRHICIIKDTSFIIAPNSSASPSQWGMYFHFDFS